MELLWFILFPGFIFSGVLGLFLTWVDRKVTARVQNRVGPPLLQPFYDVVKLLGKEVVAPKGKAFTFMFAPLLGLASVTLASVLIWRANFDPKTGFLGDLIVVLYLLTIPSISVILGGAASRNPISSVGVSREMKLLLSYELPFLIAIFTTVVKVRSLYLGEIVSYQIQNGAVLLSISSILAFIVALLCIQAKLTYVPFDIPEAETEIMGGPYIEYSGAPLAIFKLNRAIMLFVLPALLVTLFWSGLGDRSWLSILLFVLKYIAIVVAVILIKNVNPRVRIDQAMSFFWGRMTALAILAMILAVIGSKYGISWL
ncbi:TPA: NADH-quinone oxidoreductase subunit H [Candidatus Poribacteria bacterium]|nr:NADH-quinone oxidoreductase subunit H [Candidatus Poribacteria bacterium]